LGEDLRSGKPHRPCLSRAEQEEERRKERCFSPGEFLAEKKKCREGKESEDGIHQKREFQPADRMEQPYPDYIEVVEVRRDDPLFRIRDSHPLVALRVEPRVVEELAVGSGYLRKDAVVDGDGAGAGEVGARVHIDPGVPYPEDIFIRRRVEEKSNARKERRDS